MARITPSLRLAVPVSDRPGTPWAVTVTVTAPSWCSETELDSNHESNEDGGANNDTVTSIMIDFLSRCQMPLRPPGPPPRRGGPAAHWQAEPGSGLGLDTVAHIPCSVTVHRHGNVTVGQ
jgi:hypothetical protein